MILDVLKETLQKELDKIPWLPPVIIILKIVFYIAIAIMIINHYLALFRIRKELIKIREILDNSPILNNDNKKND